MMFKILLFRNSDLEEIIYEMSEYNSSNVVGLSVNKDSPIEPGTKLEMPKLEAGRVVHVRRRVFLFWKWEYLVEHDTEQGKFYVWYKKSHLTFVK